MLMHTGTVYIFNSYYGEKKGTSISTGVHKFFSDLPFYFVCLYALA